MLPRLDGVGVTVARLACELGARGHAVALVAPGPFAEVPGIELSLPRPSFPIPGLPGARCAAPRLGRTARALDRFAPELVHVATELPVGWAGRKYALERGLPLVTSTHTDYPAYLDYWGLGILSGPARWWLQRFHAPAGVTLCPSRTHREQVRGYGLHERLRVWGRGVDTERFAPCHRSESLRSALAPSSELLLLGVGRLMPEKRFDRLLEASCALPEALQRRVAVVVVGAGPEQSRLRRISPRGTRFLGELRGAELARVYASCDLFVLPSDTETFGNVILEAMASGLPAIVSSRGAASELVTSEVGRVVNMCEPGALTATLAELLSDHRLRSVLSGRAREASFRHTWDESLEQVCGGYRRAQRLTAIQRRSNDGMRDV